MLSKISKIFGKKHQYMTTYSPLEEEETEPTTTTMPRVKPQNRKNEGVSVFNRKSTKIFPATGYTMPKLGVCNFSDDDILYPDSKIKLNKLCKHYFKLFTKTDETVDIYYSEMYIIYLLIQKSNSILLNTIPFKIIQYMTDNDKPETLTTEINLPDHLKRIKHLDPSFSTSVETLNRDVISNFRKIYLNFFDPKGEKNDNIRSLDEAFFGSSTAFIVFKRTYKNYNKYDVIFIATLFIRNKINIREYPEREIELYETILLLFNTGRDITKTNIDRFIGNIVVAFTNIGGKNKKPLYKLTSKKVKLLYKNKKIVRSVYLKIKNNKEYCKINKKYILLSKLVKI